MSAAAIVLAGGLSARLGRDKASEVLCGVSLLQRAVDAVCGVSDEVVVVARPGQTLPPLRQKVRVLSDAAPGNGPLGGLATGFAAIEAASALVVACDMPLLQGWLLAELTRLLPGHDAVVPVSDGLPQLLCAVYAKRCLAVMQRRLQQGELRLAGLLDDLSVRYVEPEEWSPFDPDGLSFFNTNTEADLLRAKAFLGGLSKA